MKNIIVIIPLTATNCPMMVPVKSMLLTPSIPEQGYYDPKHREGKGAKSDSISEDFVHQEIIHPPHSCTREEFKDFIFSTIHYQYCIPCVMRKRRFGYHCPKEVPLDTLCVQLYYELTGAIFFWRMWDCRITRLRAFILSL